ncbi:hypothetical protein [Bacillus wiedmannii]|uniref:hypothetical protein n=1 Tax=Bacillus wiedmannii TaxID=1890302 RepID=UPI001243D9C5|nr:hypothetical protein [Bacillus wiedmannii]
MNREQQYDAIVEIVANAKLMLVYSDETVIDSYANTVKSNARRTIVSLGHSEKEFDKDVARRYNQLGQALKEESKPEERTHKMQVLVDIIPMASGTTLYVANIDIAGEKDFSVEGKSMKSVMVTVRAEAKARSINRGEIEILGEFNPSDMSEEDAKVWETDIFEL